jgi:hypothetical protein
MVIRVIAIWLMLASVAMAGTINSQPTIPGPLRATDATAVGRVGVPAAYKMTVGQLAGFQCWSSASGGKRCAQAMDTMNLVGGSVGLVGGKPTMTVVNGQTITPADIITKGPVVDVRSFMDGQSGRNTLAAWQANQATTDVTLALQAAIDTRLPVIAPKGTYLFTTLNIHAFTVIIGDGMYSTYFQTAVSTSPYAVTMDVGPVQNVRIEGIRFVGGTNAGQGCWNFHARALATSPFHGGLWYANIKNVMLTGFSGNSIWLRGGAANYLLPNQFNKFENVIVFRAAGTTARALVQTGQVEHTTWLNCQLDGVTTGDGTNVEISRQFTNGATTGGVSVGGVADGDNAPIATSFLNTTFQKADLAVSIDRATNTVFDSTCWFESLYRGVKVTTASRGTQVKGSHFANAGSDGAGGGYLVSVGSTSTASVEHNTITGAYDRAFIATNSKGLVERNNFFITAPLVGRSTDLTLQTSIGVDNSITVDLHKTVYVAGSATPLATINTDIGVGESLTLRALGNIILNSAGNIRIPRGKSTYAVLSGEIVTFTRVDVSNDLIITSYTRMPEGSTAARPTPELEDIGFEYYDSTLGKIIYWTGTSWRTPARTNSDEAFASVTSTGVVSASYFKSSMGAVVASAGTITPTGAIFHITGTTAINTINLPATDFTGCIRAVPDGAFTLGIAGNVGLASTAVVGKTLELCYDGTKWYPSY